MGSYIERIVWFTRLMCYKPADLVDMYYILIQQTDSHFPLICFKNYGRIMVESKQANTFVTRAQV